MAKFWKQNKVFIAVIFLSFVFRSSFADWNIVPTGSMNPTIVEGDRILVNKLAYDLNIPFTHISLRKFSDPQAGDIIIFDSKKADKRLVKRVIAIPGDTIEMLNNKLLINGKALIYDVLVSNNQVLELREHLGNQAYHVQLVSPIYNRYSSFAETKIPDGYYFVLGDNRNNSADSRFIGLVPRKEIIGKTSTVVFSHDMENYYLPRKARFLEKI